MKDNHLMGKNIEKLLFILIVITLFIIIILPSNALISCNVTTTAGCSNTKVLLLKNDTAGWYNAHAENVSANTYPYSICCNANSDGETVTSLCGTLAPAFLKLSNITNAHVEIPSNSNYLNSACIGVSNRNVTCGNYTGSCPTNYTCIASIRSSESSASNITNAHVDANCSSTYPTKICCGYSNRIPVMATSTILPSPAYRNASLRGYCNATDVDLNTITYYYTWYRNNVTNATGSIGPYAQSIQVNVNNVSNTSLIVGESWELQCIAFDGISNSSSMNSTATTIQALMPETVALRSPNNGNSTVRNRRQLLEWYPTNYTSRYEINITSSTGCGGNYYQNVTAPTTNFTPTSDLCVYSEGPNTLYLWKVRACGIDGCANWSTMWNFSIQPYVSISLTTNSINFSGMGLGQIKNTSSGTPAPFNLQNDGNVAADLVNISSDQNIWSSVPLNTEYFQMKSRQSNESNSFNTTGSVTTWVNVSTSNQTIIRRLNYTDATDSAYLDIQVTVPGAEPPGSKQAYVLFRWTETP